MAAVNPLTPGTVPVYKEMETDIIASAIPIFPYLSAGPWQVGPFTIYMFGFMAFLSIIVGSVVIGRRAQQCGPGADHAYSLMLWSLLSAFICSHLFYLVFYYSWSDGGSLRVILNPWNGMSSFGGFIGFFLGAWLYARKAKLSYLTCADTLMWGAAHAWVVARVGCAFAHDHPGRFTDFWFSVRWPLAHPDQVLNLAGLPGRHDLGLYEVFLQLVVLAALWIGNRHGQRFAGFNVATIFCIYGPGRFLLDFLRTGDPHYMGLTIAQYTALLLCAVGAALMWRGQRQGAPA